MSVCSLSLGHKVLFVSCERGQRGYKGFNAAHTTQQIVCIPACTITLMLSYSPVTYPNGASVSSFRQCHRQMLSHERAGEGTGHMH